MEVWKLSDSTWSPTTFSRIWMMYGYTYIFFPLFLGNNFAGMNRNDNIHGYHFSFASQDLSLFLLERQNIYTLGME